MFEVLMGAKNNRRKYPRWYRRHEAVLVFLLGNPSASLEQCARAVGYSTWHLSRIINSPEFNKRFSDCMGRECQKAAANFLACKSTKEIG